MTKPFDIELFLAGVLTGADATRKRHIRQAKTIQATILEHWNLDSPWRWQRKHLVWFLTYEIRDKSTGTQYYYRLTIKLMALRMGKTWFEK